MVSECLHRAENLKLCNCTYDPCSRKGFCCQCVRYHRERGELPACYFSPRAEATFDRSVAAFIEAGQSKR